MSVALKSFLDRFLQQKGDWRLQIIAQWPTIMGQLHTKVCVERMSDETLFLTVQDSCWLTELYMLSRLIIKKVNDALGEPRIKQIRLRLKPAQHFAVYQPKQSTHQPSFSYTVSEKEQQALSHIKDAHLQQVLENFLKRCKYEQQRS